MDYIYTGLISFVAGALVAFIFGKAFKAAVEKELIKIGLVKGFIAVPRQVPMAAPVVAPSVTVTPTV